jgi:hypothetical protein
MKNYIRECTYDDDDDDDDVIFVVGERPFQCRVCRMAFTTNGNMHRHMRIHEKDFPLPGEICADGTTFKDVLHRPRGKKRPAGEFKLSPTGLVMLDGSVASQGLSRKRRQHGFGSPSPRKRFRDKDGAVFVLNSQEFAPSTSGGSSALPSPSNRTVLVRCFIYSRCCCI